ncbi:putative glyoxalase superfamily protein PhnB [Stackebrandtia albiflava]|uniref:Putative glyoxalase superfamily protein PhnB n=1 Tax=Stackebrandtia albiflava TaxID=406432 RepID=A0A562V0V6_9ACTN|nr:VOC family protein [Stackebrandtia albiflava]TWJ11546.1 putative glyoxalase superfamily protein PhnB [Stackebrandtia albiflava]
MTGFHVIKLQPRLVVSGADAAIDFYGRALGATLTERYTTPQGKVVHAEIAVGDFTVAIKDEGDGDPAPRDGGVPVIMSLRVTDVDAAAAAFDAAGGTVIYPVSDWPHGERGGRFADPFGHQWMLTQVIADMSPEEIQRVTDEMFSRDD